MAESKGVTSDVIPKIATSFCAGMSRTNRTCGSVTGAIMALNLFFGRSSPEASRDKAYLVTQRLIADFEKRFGTTNCFQLCGCDLATEAGREKIMSSPELIEQCVGFAEEAAAMAMTIIEQEKEADE